LFHERTERHKEQAKEFVNNHIAKDKELFPSELLTEKKQRVSKRRVKQNMIESV